MLEKQSLDVAFKELELGIQVKILKFYKYYIAKTTISNLPYTTSIFAQLNAFCYHKSIKRTTFVRHA